MEALRTSAEKKEKKKRDENERKEGEWKKVSMLQSEGAIVRTVKDHERVSEQNKKFHSVFQKLLSIQVEIEDKACKACLPSDNDS